VIQRLLEEIVMHAFGEIIIFMMLKDQLLKVEKQTSYDVLAW
jgi:hypothetical protein